MNEFADTRRPVSQDHRERMDKVTDTTQDKTNQRATLSGTSIRQDFVDAMRLAVTGVNIVTTNGLAGKFGLTVSAMSSVSADPPMLLACINRSSPIYRAILVNRRFCVNVLSTYQHHLARSFAGLAEPGSAYNFNADQWEPGPGNVPRLIDAISSFDCLLDHAYDAGSHGIFIGRVSAAAAHKSTPLLYTNRSYGFPLTWE